MCAQFNQHSLLQSIGFPLKLPCNLFQKKLDSRDLSGHTVVVNQSWNARDRKENRAFYTTTSSAPKQAIYSSALQGLIPYFPEVWLEWPYLTLQAYTSVFQKFSNENKAFITWVVLHMPVPKSHLSAFNMETRHRGALMQECSCHIFAKSMTTKDVHTLIVWQLKMYRFSLFAHFVMVQPIYKLSSKFYKQRPIKTAHKKVFELFANFLDI